MMLFKYGKAARLLRTGHVPRKADVYAPWSGTGITREYCGWGLGMR